MEIDNSKAFNTVNHIQSLQSVSSTALIVPGNHKMAGKNFKCRSVSRRYNTDSFYSYVVRTGVP